MAVVVGQNSWVTIAEADTYLTERIGSADWFVLSDSGNPGEVSKASLLISAYNWLMASPQLNLASSLTDAAVKNAQIEAALFLLEHYESLNARRSAISQGVLQFKLSEKSERLDPTKLTIPAHIMGLLSSYGIENTVVELRGFYDA